MTPEEKDMMQHQLQLLHAEMVREDKRKRSNIRFELATKDRISAIVAEHVASHSCPA